MGAPFTPEQIAEAVDSLRGEIAQIEDEAARRVKKLEARMEMFREMLHEMTGEVPGQAKLPIQAPEEVGSLRTFLSDVVADGRPHELKELVAKAYEKGLLRGSNSPGRSIHAVMMGMQQSGLVKRQNDMWVRARP